MPLTPTNPIEQPTITVLDLHQVNINLEDNIVVFVYTRVDSEATKQTGRVVTMTLAAYQAAFLAASGNLRARTYACFQTALGVTGVVT